MLQRTSLRHYLPHYIFQKRIQFDAARVQRHHHHKEHSEVKKQSILRYSLVVIGCLNRHKIKTTPLYYKLAFYLFHPLKLH